MYWLRRPFRKKSTEKQLDSELRFHVEQLTEAGPIPIFGKRKVLLQSA